MKIEIKTFDDEYDCETCGSSWSSGGYVKIDGKKILTVTPVAHCYNGVSATEEELLVLALEKLGHTVTFDGAPYHIWNSEVEEMFRGKE